MKNSANASRQTSLSLNRPLEIVVTCEHGGNNVPREYAHLFSGRERLLGSHKGHDHGSYDLAKDLAKALNAAFHYSKTSRLLVDLNRSLGHPGLFSAITGRVNHAGKLRILEKYYHPHRNAVEAYIESRINAGMTILHIAVHTFTPELRGIKRRADAGLLYDPSRTGERELCIRMQKALTALKPAFTVRRNYPYLGAADGLATYLRKRLPCSRYLGIELEINQKHPLGDRPLWRTLRKDIISGIKTSLLPHMEQNAK